MKVKNCILLNNLYTLEQSPSEANNRLIGQQVSFHKIGLPDTIIDSQAGILR
jgi:hypothetical protein